jgi:hypothetical protein
MNNTCNCRDQSARRAEKERGSPPSAISGILRASIRFPFHCMKGPLSQEQ